MSISGIDATGKASFKTAFTYLVVSLFCLFFGAIYELFSHGVYSFPMIYAFAFPLAGGTLPFFLLALKAPKKYPAAPARNLYHAGIAAFTVGSMVQGALEIYGTTNRLTQFYWGAGIFLCLCGLTAYLLQSLWKKGRGGS